VEPWALTQFRWDSFPGKRVLQPLRRLRLGLTRRCAVPTDSALTNFKAMTSGLDDMKLLAYLLAAEGRLAEMESRPADAALSYADTIHFGNEISRGGFIINRLMGIACEAIGFNRLVKVRTQLNPGQAKAAIAKLEKINGERVTWEEVSGRSGSKPIPAKARTRHHRGPRSFFEPVFLAYSKFRAFNFGLLADRSDLTHRR